MDLPRFQKESRPIFHRVFGLNVGERLFVQPGLLQSLALISPDQSEATAEIVQLVYRAARKNPGAFIAEPHLYSQAVKLALDSGFRAALKTYGGVSESGSLAFRPRVAPPIQRHSLLTLIVRLKSAVPVSVFRLQSRLQRRLEVLSDGGPPPAVLFGVGDGTVRVYVGLNTALEPDKLRVEGLRSNYARLHGQQAADERLARVGLRRALIEHQRGVKQESLFVPSTLNPRVAGRYAGPRGLVVAADVPLAEAHFANDPDVWSGTVFRRGGNPDDYLHEVILREIRPEWIVDIDRPSDTSWKPSAAELARKFAEALFRPITERLRDLIK